jgi:hypothetical protein
MIFVLLGGGQFTINKPEAGSAGFGILMPSRWNPLNELVHSAGTVWDPDLFPQKARCAPECNSGKHTDKGPGRNKKVIPVWRRWPTALAGNRFRGPSHDRLPVISLPRLKGKEILDPVPNLPANRSRGKLELKIRAGNFVIDAEVGYRTLCIDYQSGLALF